MLKKNWFPPRSPYTLIQELIWPDEWLTLIVCMMLNCTTRKQVEKILPKFQERYPTPQDFIVSNPTEVENICRSLGFAKRRTKNMFKMTEAFLAGNWSTARDLPGIGEYGSAAHKIFFEGDVPETPPNDHALKQYVEWYNTNFRK